MSTTSGEGELVNIVLMAHDGKTAAILALAGGYPADAAEKALRTQVREIGHQMARKAQDPEELELILDVIEAGEHDDYLNNPDALLSREAIQEGEEILAHVYDSLGRARTVARGLRRPHGINEDKMERLMSLAATLCVAGLVRRGRQGFMSADLGDTTQVFWKEMINAIIKGITYVPPKRRRRRNRATVAGSYSTSSKRKRQRARSRRTAPPSLADVFGELLKRAI